MIYRSPKVRQALAAVEAEVLDRMVDAKSRVIRQDIDTSLFAWLRSINTWNQYGLAFQVAFAKASDLDLSDIAYEVVELAEQRYQSERESMHSHVWYYMLHESVARRSSASLWLTRIIDDALLFSQREAHVYRAKEEHVNPEPGSFWGVHDRAAERAWQSMSAEAGHWARISGVDWRIHPYSLAVATRSAHYLSLGAIPSVPELRQPHIDKVLGTKLLRQIDARQRTNGRPLEAMAFFLLNSLPGYKVSHDFRTSFQLDVHARSLTVFNDFRDKWCEEIICECKQLNNTVSLGQVAKLSAAMESTGCNTGLLFTLNDVSRSGRLNAAGYLRRLAARSNRHILQISLLEIEKVVRAEINFLELIQEKLFQSRSS